ncbi:hypothetical protein D9M68_511970 [compost metagenome]
MGRRRTGGDQRRADRAAFLGEGLLHAVQRRQEGLERAATQRFAGGLALAGLEGFQAALLVDPLGLVGKQHRIAIEGDAQLAAGLPPRAAGEDGRRGESRIQRIAHVVRVGREEQVAAERREVGIGTAPADEGGAGNVQAVVLDRVEHPQSGIGAVARHQDHLDLGPLAGGVEGKQLLHQGEGIAGLQDFVLVGDLVLPIGLHTLAFVDLMAFLQVEQRPRGNRHHQLVVQSPAHLIPPM